MIGYLEGVRTQTLHDSVLLLTSGGVGYQVFLALPLLARPAAENAPERYFVSTVVRETEISLYGFLDENGKRSFEALIKVSGVGPKVAMAILSVFSPAELADAVASENVALLASVPGIGKKTATRLCLDLNGRIGPSDALPSHVSAQQELVSALTNLGFPDKEVFSAVRQIPADLSEFSDRLRHALSLLSKR